MELKLKKLCKYKMVDMYGTVPVITMLASVRLHFLMNRFNMLPPALLASKHFATQLARHSRQALVPAQMLPQGAPCGQHLATFRTAKRLMGSGMAELMFDQTLLCSEGLVANVADK